MLPVLLPSITRSATVTPCLGLLLPCRETLRLLANSFGSIGKSRLLDPEIFEGTQGTDCC